MRATSMMRWLILFAGLLAATGAVAQTATVVTSCGTPGFTLVAGRVSTPTMDINGNFCTTGGTGGGGGTVTQGPPGSAGSAWYVQPGTGATFPVSSTTQYPSGATAVTASATGTTLATTATLAGVAANYTFLCGFSIRANATAAATGNSTVTGTISGTLNFTQWTAPLASGIGVTEEIFTPCIPSSAVNTAIAAVSAAPGAGGVVSVTAWGYYKTTTP